MSVAYLPKGYIYHYYNDMSVFEELNEQSCNAQNRSSGEMGNRLFEAHKITDMPHKNNMFQTDSDTTMVTMCEYPSSNYALPHWKCVLRCCTKCPCIDLPCTKSDHKN